MSYIFNNHQYYDDRLFVLYLCKGTVEYTSDGMVVTTIYHENAPDDHIWCLVTYRNYGRYPLYRIDCFSNKANAEGYMRLVEPETPLISLNCKVPSSPLNYEDYLEFKKKQNWKDYEWEKLYSKEGSNKSERIYQPRHTFQGIK